MNDRGWALVTGGSRRIGRALALSAAQAGYDVIVHARSGEGEAGEASEETAVAIRALGRRVTIRVADLAEVSAPGRLIALSPEPPALLVNCASVFEDDRIESLSPAAWDSTLAVNLRAPILLAQAFAAALPTTREGLIVNVVDQRVWRLNPTFFSYTLSKAALWTATQTLAQALAPRIRVNAIGPGPTLASVHQSVLEFEAEAAAVPMGRAVTLDELGDALRFLIAARSVTGQMIAVDGGQHLAWRTPDVGDV